MRGRDGLGWSGSCLARIVSFAAVAAVASGCAFELAPLADSGAGGAGGTPSAAGSGGQISGYEVLISYDGRSVPSSQTEVPILVRLDPDRIDYDLASEDGSDLRFFSEDGTTALPYEIERWAPGGVSILWVRLPAMDPAGGSFRMRFGDPEAAAPPAASEVWSRYEGVYHFADPSGAIARDSASGLDGASTAVSSAEGRIGDGFSFDGSTSQVTVSDVMTFDVQPGQARSFSIWFRRATTEATTMVLGRTKNSCCDGWSLVILGDQFANLRHDVTLGNCCTGPTQDFFAGASALPNGQDDVDWHRATAVMDRVAGTTTLYLDATVIESSPLGTSGPMAGGALAFGFSADDTSYFLGTLDEARIGAAAFDADWIALTYAIASQELLSFGTVQPR